MPLERIPGDVAIERQNLVARWPKRDGGDNRVEPIAKPAFRAGFKLQPGDRIFTIGSCFARNVERELVKRGFEIPAWRVLKQDEEEFTKFGPNILNNYSVASIYNEVAWALDPAKPFRAEQNIFEVYPQKFIDVHLNRGIRPASSDTVLSRRRAITQVYREIPTCPLIIITLGLAEAWYDREHDIYLNARPHHAMFTSSPQRYELHVMDYHDVSRCLTATFDLLKANLHPRGRVLLTVSPVPLQSTYRDQDVMVANTYSKSVLRAAADEIVAKYDFVEYFPSFESVQLTRRDLAWEDDQTHVRKDIVDINVSRMIAAYTTAAVDEDSETAGSESTPGPNTEIVEAIKQKIKIDADQIFGALENWPDLVASDPEIAAAYCDACLELKKPSAAAVALETIPESWSPNQRDFLRARLLAAQGKPGDAVAILRKLVDGSLPKHLAHDVWFELLVATIALNDIEAAVAHIGRWKKAMRKVKGAEPFRLVAVALAKCGDGARADSYFREGLSASDRNPNRIIIDYAEFLADEGQTSGAKDYLSKIDTSNRAILNRKSELLRRLGAEVQ